MITYSENFLNVYLMSHYLFPQLEICSKKSADNMQRFIYENGLYTLVYNSKTYRSIISSPTPFVSPFYLNTNFIFCNVASFLIETLKNPIAFFNLLNLISNSATLKYCSLFFSFRFLPFVLIYRLALWSFLCYFIQIYRSLNFN